MNVGVQLYVGLFYLQVDSSLPGKSGLGFFNHQKLLIDQLINYIIYHTKGGYFQKHIGCFMAVCFQVRGELRTFELNNNASFVNTEQLHLLL